MDFSHESGTDGNHAPPFPVAAVVEKVDKRRQRREGPCGPPGRLRGQRGPEGPGSGGGEAEQPLPRVGARHRAAGAVRVGLPAGAGLRLPGADPAPPQAFGPVRRPGPGPTGGAESPSGGLPRRRHGDRGGGRRPVPLHRGDGGELRRHRAGNGIRTADGGPGGERHRGHHAPHHGRQRLPGEPGPAAGSWWPGRIWWTGTSCSSA